MKIKFLMLFAISLALIVGCAQTKITSESGTPYDFTSIRTYQWTDAPAAIREQDDTYFNHEMQKALNNELAARGWKQVLDAASATVQVTYYLKLKAHPEYAGPATDRDGAFAGGLVFNKDQRKWNYEQRDPDQIVYLVETATLHCRMSDVATGKSIWNGMLETNIDRSLPDEKLNAEFQYMARKLISRLPRKTAP